MRRCHVAPRRFKSRSRSRNASTLFFRFSDGSWEGAGGRAVTERDTQLLGKGRHAEIRTLRGSGGLGERHEQRFRGDRGVVRGDQGFLASPYRRGALAEEREPGRDARGVPLRPPKVGASIGGVS